MCVSGVRVWGACLGCAIGKSPIWSCSRRDGCSLLPAHRHVADPGGRRCNRSARRCGRNALVGVLAVALVVVVFTSASSFFAGEAVTTGTDDTTVTGNGNDIADNQANGLGCESSSDCASGMCSHWRDCHSAAPPSTFSRCFNSDGERVSAK